MKDLFDVQVWQKIAEQTLTQLSTTVANFGAQALLALVILAVGWLTARIVQAIAKGALSRLGADKLLRRAGISDSLERAGVTRPLSEILARFLFWLVMLTFLLLAVDALELKALSGTIDRLLVYVPRVAGAVVLVFAGLVLGRLTRGVVASGAAFGSAENAARLAAISHVAIIVTTAVLAVEQLGVETEILASVTTAIVAALGLSMGVAFALGARGVVGHVLAGHFLRQRFTAGQQVEIDGEPGVITRVGTVDTLVEQGDDVTSYPNNALLEKTVKHRDLSQD